MSDYTELDVGDLIIDALGRISIIVGVITIPEEGRLLYKSYSVHCDDNHYNEHGAEMDFFYKSSAYHGITKRISRGVT